MHMPGKRIRERQWIERGRYVVSVDIELVYPEFDPSEPCYEAETVDFLREVAERAERGDVDWLRAHGRVFELVEAAGPR